MHVINSSCCTLCQSVTCIHVQGRKFNITDTHLESQNVIPAFLWDKLCELARGGACGYKLSHDQLSSVDQQYKNCDPYKARLGQARYSWH